MINVRDKLAETPFFENLGPIDNPKGFSKSCSHIFNAGSMDIKLPWSATCGYRLNSAPEQFHPIILQAIDLHHQKYERMNNCWVHYNQGILPPRETFRIGQIHFDAWAGVYPVTEYPNNDVFLVSDSLPTQFALQKYDMPETLTGTDKVLNEQIIEVLKEQTAENNIVTPAAYDMVRYDSFTVHRAQPPQNCTKRTFLMIRFC